MPKEVLYPHVPKVNGLTFDTTRWASLHKLITDAAVEENNASAMYEEIAREADSHRRPEVARVLRSIAADEAHHKRLLDKLAEQTRVG